MLLNFGSIPNSILTILNRGFCHYVAYCVQHHGHELVARLPLQCVMRLRRQQFVNRQSKAPIERDVVAPAQTGVREGAALIATLISIKDSSWDSLYGKSMVWLCDELRVLATALIFSLALALGFGFAAIAALPGTSVELHHLASVHPASIPHDAYKQEPCDDRLADCCSSVAHCSGTVFVAPADALGFAGSAHRTWTLARAQCLHGIDPLVNRHPPRDLG